MELTIVRHADASFEAARDFDRPLTPKGERQSKRLGKFLAELGPPPERIFTSPLLRARETADLLATALGTPAPITEGRLACGMRPEEACEILYGQMECASLMLVGHNPDLAELLGYLVSRGGALIEMKKGACARLDLEGPGEGKAILRWLITPALIKSVD